MGQTVVVPDDQEEVDYTPLGDAVRRWFPAIAIVVGLIPGAAFGLFTGSWLTAVMVTAVIVAVMLFGFYVPPLRGWPDDRGESPGERPET